MIRSIHRYRSAPIALLVFCSMARAEEREIKSIKEILPALEAKPLLICDLDNTIIEPTQYIGSSQWHEYLVGKFQKVDRLTKGEAERKAVDVWNQVQRLVKVQAVERETVRIIRDHQDAGLIVLALTARYPAVAERTIEQLASIDVNFSRRSIHATDVTLKAEDDMFYKSGILFVGENNDKGKALVAFLHRIRLTPTAVVFVDDKARHVANVDRALKEQGIRCLAFRYGGADAHVKAFWSDIHYRGLLTEGELSEEFRDALRKAGER